MKREHNKTEGFSRRHFLSSSFIAATAAASALKLRGEPAPKAAPAEATEPFWGAHQGGITTPIQRHTYFATFDLTATDRDAVVALLKSWTAAAARMTQGLPSEEPVKDITLPGSDSGSAQGLSASRLTMTFGFGPGLFTKDGKDRYGLAARRPAALIDLPTFVGDQLVEARTGGDISVQACADDPEVAFHAIRQLAKLSYDAAQLRWVQTGYVPHFDARETPRNHMGFKDGTRNIDTADSKTMDKFIWVSDDGPDWMRGGSYVVARRIRIALEHWDRMNTGFQEQTVGRHKHNGAPLGGTNEFDKADYDATDKDGNYIIPENSHARLAAAENNDGAQILRRPYSFNDGATFTAERWPPWRQAMEFDAGLFFICYQRDPRTGFVKIFERMAKFDMMNQFVTHTAGGLFACPGGVREGEFVGQKLFEKS